MGSRPDVSVVLPTRGDTPHLRAALRSALASEVELELLLVHDRRDGEPALVEALLADSRVRVVAHPSTGVSAARNAAIDAARGRYVALLDDDDAWLPGHLEHAVETFGAHPEAGLAGCDAVLFEDDTGDGSGPLPDAIDDLPRLSPGRATGPVGLRDLILANMFHPSTVVLDRQRLGDDERFDPRIAYMEDYDLWLRLARRHTLVFDARPGTLIRKHRRNVSRNWRRMAKGSLDVLGRFSEEGIPEGTIDRTELDGRLGRVWHDLAYACVVDGDVDDARRALRESMSRVPGYWKNYAYWVAFRLPDFARRALFARGRRFQAETGSVAPC